MWNRGRGAVGRSPRSTAALEAVGRGMGVGPAGRGHGLVLVIHGGLLVVYLVICAPAWRRRRLGHGRNGGCHCGRRAVIGDGRGIRQSWSPPSFIMLRGWATKWRHARRRVPLALTAARHDKGGKRRIRGRGKRWHAMIFATDKDGWDYVVVPVVDMEYDITYHTPRTFFHVPPFTHAPPFFARTQTSNTHYTIMWCHDVRHDVTVCACIFFLSMRKEREGRKPGAFMNPRVIPTLGAVLIKILEKKFSKIKFWSMETVDMSMLSNNHLVKFWNKYS